MGKPNLKRRKDWRRPNKIEKTALKDISCPIQGQDICFQAANTSGEQWGCGKGHLQIGQAAWLFFIRVCFQWYSRARFARFACHASNWPMRPQSANKVDYENHEVLCEAKPPLILTN